MFVYAELADSFILFGGWHEEANGTYIRLNDTWLFSLKNRIWTERHPSISPSARSDSEVAYDPLEDSVLLLGGFSGSAYLGDIWSYTLRSDSWTARPAAVEPSPRADGRLVHLDGEDRFILFGGNDYSGSNHAFHHLADTWTYNWNSNLWKPLPLKNGPGPRDYPVFAFDSDAKQAFLTGGYGNGTILSDLWAFDVTIDAWANITPRISPPPRFAATGGFDPVHQVLVLVSGLGNSGLLADTWHYTSQSSSTASSLLMPIAVVGVGSVVVGLAFAIAFGLPRKRRSREMP
jgi:hypothetical protein